jgi:hypothetical protein
VVDRADLVVADRGSKGIDEAVGKKGTRKPRP